MHWDMINEMKNEYLIIDNLEMFYLNCTLNFGIPPVLVFQLEVYYKIDRLLTGITARWYSNKSSLARIRWNFEWFQFFILVGQGGNRAYFILFSYSFLFQLLMLCLVLPQYCDILFVCWEQWTLWQWWQLH